LLNKAVFLLESSLSRHLLISHLFKKLNAVSDDHLMEALKRQL